MESISRKQKVSVILAAYNEEPRIGVVLSVVSNHPLIDEVIVVNDGSFDKTSEVVKKFNVMLLENEINIGKTASCKRGLAKAKNEVILFLDADLIGLTDQNIYDLVNPVLDGYADWTLSLRSNSAIHMKLLKIDCLSGERAVRKDLLEDPLIWSKPHIGYSMEVLMNKSLLNNGSVCFSVKMPNIKLVTKTGKAGFFEGWYNELKMINQIFRAMPFNQILCQFLKMSYISRKTKKSLLVREKLNPEIQFSKTY
jgi:glycosyltransferase involved in cell wall biosynthesis